MFYGCSFLGPLQIPALFISIGYIAIASLYYYKFREVDETVVETDAETSILEKCANYWRPKETITISKSRNDSIASCASEGDQTDATAKGGSDVYFKVLFLSCLVTMFYKQLLMTCLALIPIGIYLCNLLIQQFGIKEYTTQKLDEATAFVQVDEAHKRFGTSF